MQGLDTFENAVMAKLLVGDHPLLVALRAQAESAWVTSRQYTGAGFHCEFAMPPEVMPVEPANFEIGDVHAVISGLRRGAGFVLFIRGGRLDALEGYSYDEPWPEAIGEFELCYQSEPSNPGLPA